MTPETTTTTAGRGGRIGALDGLRGLALLAMASYHFTWDLEYFGYVPPATATEGFFRFYARGIASTFLFLVGFSLMLAHGREIRWRSFGRRLAIVAGAAALITVATWFAMPDAFIFFGILHAIAVTSIVGLAFRKVPPLVTLILAIAVIALPNVYRSAAFDHPLLLWIGLSQHLPRSNDFVPLFPWFGPVLIGMAAQQLAQRAGLLRRAAAWWGGPAPLQFIGRHSLAFYLLHQPVLLALVYGASLVAPPPAPDPAAGYIRSCESACIAEGSSAPTCMKFCDCTLNSLLEQDLFTPLQSGAIKPAEDERILKLARECTAVSQ